MSSETLRKGLARVTCVSHDAISSSEPVYFAFGSNLSHWCMNSQEMKIKVAAPEDGVIDASQVRLALSWLGEEPSDKA